MKIHSKLCQILQECFQNGQSVLTVCLSGENSPNLVTLPTTSTSHLSVINTNCQLVVNYSLTKILASTHLHTFQQTQTTTSAGSM